MPVKPPDGVAVTVVEPEPPFPDVVPLVEPIVSVITPEELAYVLSPE